MTFRFVSYTKGKRAQKKKGAVVFLGSEKPKIRIKNGVNVLRSCIPSDPVTPEVLLRLFSRNRLFFHLLWLVAYQFSALSEVRQVFVARERHINNCGLGYFWCLRY